MILEMVKAFLFIFVAEMGDKTQILAGVCHTVFIKKSAGYRAWAFLNHGLAVILEISVQWCG